MKFNPSKLILIVCLALFCQNAPAATVVTNNVNGVMAKVNNYIITLQELYGTMARLGRSTTMSPEQVRELVLSNLIDDKLILSDYENSGYAIPDSYFEDQFDEYIKENFSDRISFVKTMQAEGKQIDEFREEFKERRIIDIMASQKIGQQISISPFKIERYYNEHQDLYHEPDQVDLRLIVIPAKGSDDPEAIATAEMVHEKLLKGGDFAELAREYSSGIEAKNGGAKGWQKRDIMLKALDDVVFNMDVGETSNLVITPSVIFIAKVEGKKAAHVQPLSEVREQIERDLRAEETSKRRKQWIEGLRKKSFVRTF